MKIEKLITGILFNKDEFIKVGKMSLKTNIPHSIRITEIEEKTLDKEDKRFKTRTWFIPHTNKVQKQNRIRKMIDELQKSKLLPVGDGSFILKKTDYSSFLEGIKKIEEEIKEAQEEISSPDVYEAEKAQTIEDIEEAIQGWAENLDSEVNVEEIVDKYVNKICSPEELAHCFNFNDGLGFKEEFNAKEILSSRDGSIEELKEEQKKIDAEIEEIKSKSDLKEFELKKLEEIELKRVIAEREILSEEMANKSLQGYISGLNDVVKNNFFKTLDETLGVLLERTRGANDKERGRIEEIVSSLDALKGFINEDKRDFIQNIINILQDVLATDKNSLVDFKKITSAKEDLVNFALSLEGVDERDESVKRLQSKAQNLNSYHSLIDRLQKGEISKEEATEEREKLRAIYSSRLSTLNSIDKIIEMEEEFVGGEEE